MWGPDRMDVSMAAAEFTENIAILEVLAPSDISNLSEERRTALRNFR